MGDVVRIHDYHLRRMTQDAAKIAGELVKFAKDGGPVVEGSAPCVDPWAGRHCPNGIEDLWPGGVA